ncbi:MAG: hypothetical protein H0T76_19305 [Nannocystis sp.]|nr:hypothetical protein [Nannocystis sp.]MBA3548638.1 hypothetical protein [Nannocystis sp.]
MITDSRTTLAQALHAHLIAELADVAGWALLISLTERLNHEPLTVQLRDALDNETLHRESESVQQWLAAQVQLIAKGDLQ